MSFSHEELQKQFLYNRKWDSRKDKMLISSLLAKKEACKPHLPTESPHAIVAAMNAVNDVYKAGLRALDVVKRIQFLRKCYLTFAELANRADTFWELPRNIVHADEAVWTRLVQEKRLYEAYRHLGEPLYFMLVQLFSPTDVKLENSTSTGWPEDSTEALEDNTEVLEDST
ncbi:uncharacterized protein LOC131008750 [Salvia miltiorrhiza]|uniref:uncharacterized protein LOC131008750 n=1 Tax=Salvia miltiorrhiza TaxID=226208 RepID=UPI0025AD4806|nr:uncharacterized protein LOC131008750 [Salvia miltiorrhiza]